MIDTRTPIEKARDEKHQKICNEFLSLSNQMPECAPHRIFRIIAERVGMSVPGVKNIIVNNGLYQCSPSK